MCTPYHSIWFLALVFQKSTIILTSQKAKKNVKKSSLLDYGNFSYITIMGS